MKKVNYDAITMGSFWNKCGSHIPHTVTKVRTILTWVAGEIVDPKVAPDNFSDEDCREILDALRHRNRSQTQRLVLEAMRRVKENQ